MPQKEWIIVREYPVHVTTTEDDMRYCACPDLPGCHAILMPVEDIHTSMTLYIAEWLSTHDFVPTPYTAHMKGNE